MYVCHQSVLLPAPFFPGRLPNFINHPQNSSAMDSSDPKLSETGLRSTGAFLVVSQLLGDHLDSHLAIVGGRGLSTMVAEQPGTYAPEVTIWTSPARNCCAREVMYPATCTGLDRRYGRISTEILLLATYQARTRPLSAMVAEQPGTYAPEVTIWTSPAGNCCARGVMYPATLSLIHI